MGHGPRNLFITVRPNITPIYGLYFSHDFFSPCFKYLFAQFKTEVPVYAQCESFNYRGYKIESEVAVLLVLAHLTFLDNRSQLSFFSFGLKINQFGKQRDE